MTTRNPIGSTQRAIIRATQAGLPLVSEPYAEVAAAVGVDVPTVLSHLDDMLETKIIRRIGVVPNHYALGLAVNAMTVWDVEDDRLEVLGPQVGAFDFVSHCYERPRHPPQWPFNLFAMVHGQAQAEVDEKIETIARLLGTACRSRDVLISRRILKKTGLRLTS